mmetsp:Transcript_10745/g.31795  ORF Transcript_10745/g.31795 Transcript_10745/m.31795 type:complete len:132 (+) Transcript_10745:875-1270(+)
MAFGGSGQSRLERPKALEEGLPHGAVDLVDLCAGARRVLGAEGVPQLLSPTGEVLLHIDPHRQQVGGGAGGGGNGAGGSGGIRLLSSLSAIGGSVASAASGFAQESVSGLTALASDVGTAAGIGQATPQNE